ncbi:hypothetical protein SAMN04488072_109162 [Lentibacillus halodurans]|uniref:Uncharacterized protein n=1 Tax=Lentibacillus halodurans TaxID=237679 RepID=A0A1I0Z7P8_9BACI|nr:hypothetical protein [Lentibacillus halodurans]SFB20468.1 hypothetical protein SAMN04488072_109162 [Lentibacillus halodurans]
MIASNYIEHVGKITEANNNSSNHLFQLFKATRTGLQTFLDNNTKELTPEERMIVGNQNLEINRMAIKLDADNKSYLLKIVGAIGTPLALLGVAVLAGIANNNQQELSSNEVFGEDTDEDSND